MKYLFALSLAALLAGCSSPDSKKLKALIIDGQNNHAVWPKSTVMMKAYLEETGLYEVDVNRTAYTWRGEEFLEAFPIDGLPPTTPLPESKSDEGFLPDFSQYDLVVSNFGWKAADWPEATQRALERYVAAGGGLAIVHAANNSFGDWAEFNKMIGLGGWGGRTEKDGPYVYINKEGETVRDLEPGGAGGHGPQHEYSIQARVPEHPIMKGLPPVWLHAKDELYHKLRGPAENMTVLATAFSSPEFKGTDRHEPVLMTINYGKGRVFHTAMGHHDYSFECVGFIVTFNRGAEWAATGAVTRTEIPSDFPTADKVSQRPFPKRLGDE